MVENVSPTRMVVTIIGENQFDSEILPTFDES